MCSTTVSAAVLGVCSGADKARTGVTGRSPALLSAGGETDSLACCVEDKPRSDGITGELALPAAAVLTDEFVFAIAAGSIPPIPNEASV